MAQYELNLQDYFRILKKRQWVIAGTLFIVSGLVLVYTNLQTPIYEATATVKIEPSMSISGISDQMGWDAYTAINTEVKIIKSAIVAERTAKKLGLVTGDTSASKKEMILVAIQSKINADRIGETNLINISASSSDPKETEQLANGTAQVYIEKGMEDRTRRARELRQFIQIQLEEAKSKLKKSEDELKVYSEKTGAKGMGGYIATRLVDLQTRRSELLKKYTNQHPEVQRLNQQINSIENQMRELPAEELDFARLQRELNINEELYTLLSKRLKESQISEADNVQSAFIVTPAVEPKAPVKPNRMMNLTIGVFTGLFLGFLLALLIENLDTSIGTIEDVEKYLNLAVLGIISHITQDQTVDSRKQTGNVLTEQQKRLEQFRSRLVVFQSSRSPYAEAYHTLRTNMGFVLKNPKGNILSVTSAGIGEGKTLTSANFALTCAKSGLKTLLLEADLRRPLLHRLFGLKRDPGLSDCLIGVKRWQDALKGTSDFLLSDIKVENILKFPGIENLKIITSGPIPPNPVDLFSSQNLGNILKEASAQFDIIILDCPPALIFSDAIIVSTHATGSVLVYKAGKVPRVALKRTKDLLTNAKVNVLGIVLNDIKSSEMEPGYGYYYSYKYYDKRTDKDNLV